MNEVLVSRFISGPVDTLSPRSLYDFHVRNRFSSLRIVNFGLCFEEKSL